MPTFMKSTTSSLRDFLASHKLQPAGVQLGDQLTPLAREAATYDGTLWVVPQWMCADFLIYRADEPALDRAQTLNALEAALSQSHGLLLNMKGEEQLGELYLNFLPWQEPARHQKRCCRIFLRRQIL